MNQEKFLWLIQNFTSLTIEEADELIVLQKEYPYSQVIHNMVARASQDLGLSEKDRYLHKSAIYSTDRSVLKAIMTASKKERIPLTKVTQEPSPEFYPLRVTESDIETSTPSIIEINKTGEDLYSQVIRDLAELSESKHRFEEVVAGLEKNAPVPLLSSSNKSAIKEIHNPELGDGLIEEIKNSKRKIKPEGPKQKEQIEIIDQFIKAQPSISKSKPTRVPEATEDLTEKVDIYGDNIVSETLVEILLKQGKKEKAVEMLKKLIWKFPQKKTYFAAQIEELKK